MENKLSVIFEKYSINEEDQREIIGIFNKSLIEISERILKENRETKKTVKENKETRFASKKAEKYAEENDIGEDMFEEDKITKKMVEDKIKELKKGEDIKTEKVKKNKEIKEEKVKCSGITQRGDPCKCIGTENPEGAKRKYCIKHVDDWKTYECESDSSTD